MRIPPKKDVKADLVELIERGVNLLYIYSGGIRYHYYNYCRQLKAMFRSIDFQARVETAYFDKAEHTYPSIEDRDKLMATVCDWMQAHYEESKE